MIRKPTLCAQSAAVVAHLVRFGPSTMDELADAFPQEERSLLRKRLSNLCDGNWLDISFTAAGGMLWLVAPRARARAALVTRPERQQAAAPSAPPVLVPPRRINIMQGTYTPAPMAPARPGALDHKACASVGVRC